MAGISAATAYPTGGRLEKILGLIDAMRAAMRAPTRRPRATAVRLSPVLDPCVAHGTAGQGAPSGVSLVVPITRNQRLASNQAWPALTCCCCCRQGCVVGRRIRHPDRHCEGPGGPDSAVRCCPVCMRACGRVGGRTSGGGTSESDSECDRGGPVLLASMSRLDALCSCCPWHQATCACARRPKPHCKFCRCDSRSARAVPVARSLQLRPRRSACARHQPGAAAGAATGQRSQSHGSCGGVTCPAACPDLRELLSRSFHATAITACATRMPCWLTGVSLWSKQNWLSLSLSLSLNPSSRSSACKASWCLTCPRAHRQPRRGLRWEGHCRRLYCSQLCHCSRYAPAEQGPSPRSNATAAAAVAANTAADAAGAVSCNLRASGATVMVALWSEMVLSTCGKGRSSLHMHCSLQGIRRDGYGRILIGEACQFIEAAHPWCSKHA